MTRLLERRLLVLILVGALVGIYLIWWVGYATAHEVTRYRQLEPGAPAAMKGVTVRLERLTMTATLTGDIGGLTAAPVPGAVWVVGRFEVITRGPGQTCFCEFRLLATTGARWPDTFPTVSRKLEAFSSSEPGQTEFEEIYEIPARFAGRLAGVAVHDSTSSAPEPVLRPPR